jgi:hypothetical protein
MKKQIALATALVAALSACGGREALKPVAGQTAAPVPKGATQPLTPDEMMAASSQARPERNAELLRQSEVRKDDPFDLPPEQK